MSIDEPVCDVSELVDIQIQHRLALLLLLALPSSQIEESLSAPLIEFLCGIYSLFICHRTLLFISVSRKALITVIYAKFSSEVHEKNFSFATSFQLSNVGRDVKKPSLKCVYLHAVRHLHDSGIIILLFLLLLHWFVCSVAVEAWVDEVSPVALPCRECAHLARHLDGEEEQVREEDQVEEEE